MASDKASWSDMRRDEVLEATDFDGEIGCVVGEFGERSFRGSGWRLTSSLPAVVAAFDGDGDVLCGVGSSGTSSSSAKGPWLIVSGAGSG